MIDISFLLGVFGLSLIVTKSKLFKKPRIFFTSLYQVKSDNLFYWWIDSVMSCYMCFSVYAGAALYILRLFSFESYQFVATVFSAVGVSTLLVDLWQYICRK